MISPFFSLLIGVPISILIIPMAWRLAPYLGMVDLPDARKVHSVPIPRVGGWGIVAGSLLPLMFALKFDPMMQSYVIGGLTLFVFGLWDDAKQLSHWVKFVGQALAACVVVYYGNLYVTNWPFIGAAMSPGVAKVLTVISIMGMINAINHSDGLDGLAAGESMLSLIAISSLAFMASSETLLAIALSIVGGLLGFLRYNTHPARVFMGDAGSQFLGFALSFLAIHLTQVALPAVSAATPLLFLGLPISDILVVLYKRINGKMNWFKATRNHVHHRLLDLGFDHYETVVTIYSVQAVLVTLAVILRFDPDWVVASAYFAVVTGVFAVLALVEARGWRRRTGGESSLAKTVRILRANDRIKRGPLAVISVALPMCMLSGPLVSSQVPRDFGVIAGVIAIISAIEIGLDRHRGSLVNRLSMYVASIFSCYLFVHFAPPSSFAVSLLSLSVVGVLGLAVGIFIRYTSEASFGSTPTDYLIAFGVLAIVILGGADVFGPEIVQMAIFSFVMLYACESIMSLAQSRWNLLTLSTLLALLTIAGRGLL